MKTELRDYQRTAVDQTIDVLKDSDRCKVIMPCGTGKTLVGIAVSEILGSGYRMLVQAPSLALIKQLLDKYVAELPACEIMVVCSDDTTAEEARRVHDIPEVTTNAARIGERMRVNQSLLVFCTYQSTARLAEAVRDHSSPGFDFALFDESHRMAGPASDFNVALDESQVPIYKRLFMTATPRFANSRDVDTYDYVSMDDATQFGELAYEMRLSEAIAGDHLTDYEVCIFIVKESEVRDQIESDENVMDVAKRMAVAKAMHRRDLRKLLVYHNRIDSMKRFSNDLMPQTFAALQEQRLVDGHLWSRALDGKDSADRRSRVIQQFAKLNGNFRAILNNCRVLQEGVDVPAIDGIALLDPRSNIVDLMQMLGRMLRKAPNKKIATLVMPVFVPLEMEDSIDLFVASSEFSHVYDLIAVLKSHDDRISSWISSRGKGKHEIPKIDVDATSEAFRGNGMQRLWLDAIECRVIDRFACRERLTIDVLTEWFRRCHAETNSWPTCSSNYVFPDGSSCAAIAKAMSDKLRGWNEDLTMAGLVRQLSGKPSKEKLTVSLVENWFKRCFADTGHWPKEGMDYTFPDGSSISSVAQALRLKTRGWNSSESMTDVVCRLRGSARKMRLTRKLVEDWFRKCYSETGSFPTTNSEYVFEDGTTCHALDVAMANKGRGWTEDVTFSGLVKELSGVPEKPNLTEELIENWFLKCRKDTGKWPSRSLDYVFEDGSSCKCIAHAMYAGYRGWTSRTTMPQVVSQLRKSERTVCSQ